MSRMDESRVWVGTRPCHDTECPLAERGRHQHKVYASSVPTPAPAAPIVEERAACVVHRMGADYRCTACGISESDAHYRCTACGISESDAHYRGHSISGYDAS